MTLSNRAEEILESLWTELIEHNKAYCDAALLKDDEAVAELKTSGCINIAENRITLLDKGKDEARSCIRRHRLAERLMVDVLDVKKTMVHEAGCKFEHLLHKGLDDNVCTFLGHPKTCPHGRQIPAGRCCKDLKSIPKKLIMPLVELGLNKKAKISYLQTRDKEALQKIVAIGALPKTDIILIQKFPSYVLQLGKSQFAIDKELASQIFVRRV